MGSRAVVVELSSAMSGVGNVVSCRGAVERR